MTDLRHVASRRDVHRTGMHTKRTVRCEWTPSHRAVHSVLGHDYEAGNPAGQATTLASCIPPPLLTYVQGWLPPEALYVTKQYAFAAVFNLTHV